MATALSFLSSALLAPVQAVVLFFAPHAAVVRAPSPGNLHANAASAASLSTSVTTSLAIPASMQRNSSQEASGIAPSHALRVLRVSEPGAPTGSAGRMRMSGRFADVCAELDRLAAQDMRTA